MAWQEGKLLGAAARALHVGCPFLHLGHLPTPLHSLNVAGHVQPHGLWS